MLAAVGALAESIALTRNVHLNKNKITYRKLEKKATSASSRARNQEEKYSKMMDVPWQLNGLR